MKTNRKKKVFVGQNIKYENKSKNKTLLFVATGTNQASCSNCGRPLEGSIYAEEKGEESMCSYDQMRTLIEMPSARFI